jgi:hypothetical protein
MFIKIQIFFINSNLELFKYSCNEKCMSKVKQGSKLFLYPIPIVLLGANVDGKPN